MPRTQNFGQAHPDRLGLPLGAQLAPAVFEVANQFLLLGINRDHRLPGRLEGGHHGVDVLELGIAVGMTAALAGFGVGLQAEAQPAQQATDQLLSGDEATLCQRRRQMALAFADPPQRRFGIAADGRLHQFAQGGQKPRLRFGCRLAATTRTTHPATQVRRTCLQIGKATIDRAACNPGCPRYRDHPAVTGRPRLACREQPSLALIQNWRKRLEAGFDGGDVDHPDSINAPAAPSPQYPDSIVAFFQRS